MEEVLSMLVDGDEMLTEMISQGAPSQAVEVIHDYAKKLALWGGICGLIPIPFLATIVEVVMRWMMYLAILDVVPSEHNIIYLMFGFVINYFVFYIVVILAHCISAALKASIVGVLGNCLFLAAFNWFATKVAGGLFLQMLLKT